jgi:hypothetical protein
VKGLRKSDVTRHAIRVCHRSSPRRDRAASGTHVEIDAADGSWQGPTGRVRCAVDKTGVTCILPETSGQIDSVGSSVSTQPLIFQLPSGCCSSE